MIEVVGFIAMALNVTGMVMLARKLISAWFVRIAAIIMWGIYAYETWSLSLLLNSILFFCINCYGYWNWKRRRGHLDSCKINPCDCGRGA